MVEVGNGLPYFSGFATRSHDACKAIGLPDCAAELLDAL